jgi:hypothetical protein
MPLLFSCLCPCFLVVILRRGRRTCCCFAFAVTCFPSPIQNPVISTGAIHSLTVNRAAEKSAFLLMSHPCLDAFVLLFSCHPSPQAEDLLLPLPLPVLLFVIQ